MARSISGDEQLYRIAGEQARRNAETYLRELYRLDLRITSFDATTPDRLWSTPRFAWAEIASHDFGPIALEIAVWIGDELEALAVCTGHGPQVIVRHVEGRPDSHPQLKGQRLWVVLEVAANFATSLGKREIWWHPEREEFLRFCVETIGAEQRGRQCMLRLVE